MDTITFIRWLETADLEPFEYSGRGMFGKKCVAVRANSEVDLVISVMTSMVENCAERSDLLDMLDELSSPKTDSLGKGTVVYWESMQWPSAEDE